MIATLSTVVGLMGKYKKVIVAILVLALLATVFATGWKMAKYACLQEKMEAVNAANKEWSPGWPETAMP